MGGDLSHASEKKNCRYMKQKGDSKLRDENLGSYSVDLANAAPSLSAGKITSSIKW